MRLLVMLMALIAFCAAWILGWLFGEDAAYGRTSAKMAWFLDHLGDQVYPRGYIDGATDLAEFLAEDFLGMED